MHKQSILLVLALMMISCAESGTLAVPVADDGIVVNIPVGAVPGHIRVKVKAPIDNVPSIDGLSVLGNYTLTRTFPYAGKFEQRHQRHGLDLWYDVFFDEDIPLTKAVAGTSAIEGVETVECIRPVKFAAEIPNDPEFYRQWHYYNQGTKMNSVAGSDINLLPAWDVTAGTPNVIVSVCDGSSQYDHPDLAQNEWINETELNGVMGKDDDNNGYVDDVYGFNFITYDGQNPVGVLMPADHGTHIAGTIAAVNNNGTGVCGIAGGDGSAATGVRILNAQTSDGSDKVSAYIAASIVYSADMGAVLINCSWGFPGTDPTPQSIVDAIDYFNSEAGFDENGNQVGPMAGGLAIFAAGNDNLDYAYPAMDDNVLAVSSFGADFVKAYYSNYGPWVDIAAPGGDAQKNAQIYSTLTDSKYGSMQGTSMACPHVTGVAALVVSKFGGPGFTREKLIYILKKTANRDFLEYNGNSKVLGVGRVDAGAAVTYLAPEPAQVSGISSEVSVSAAELRWTIPGSAGSEPYLFNIYYSTHSLSSLDPANPGTGVEHEICHIPDGAEAGSGFSWNLTALNPGTKYYVRISSENINGAVSSLSEETTFTTKENAIPVISALDGISTELKSHESTTLRFKVSDSDGDDLFYGYSSKDPNISLEGFSASVSGEDVIVITINALRAKENTVYTAEFYVTDRLDTAFVDITYKVGKNNAPSETGGSIPDIILNSRSAKQTVDMSEYFSDPDGENLIYTVELSSTQQIISAATEGDILTVTGKSYGVSSATITASDARGATASQVVNILVRDGSKLVDVYPNPVVNTLYVRTPSTVTADLTLTNRVGTVVFRENGVTLSPFAPFQRDLSAIPGGVFYLRVRTDSVNEVYSIIKQ